MEVVVDHHGLGDTTQAGETPHEGQAGVRGVLEWGEHHGVRRRVGQRSDERVELRVAPLPTGI
jgi:hypothetical protein